MIELHDKIQLESLENDPLWRSAQSKSGGFFIVTDIESCEANDCNVANCDRKLYTLASGFHPDEIMAAPCGVELYSRNVKVLPKIALVKPKPFTLENIRKELDLDAIIAELETLDMVSDPGLLMRVLITYKL